MTADPSTLARPAIRQLRAYSSARSEIATSPLLLDANEAPGELWEGTAADGLNRYPEPQPAELVEQLAALYDVPRDWIMLGRGSDDGIDALIRTFCESGRDSILVNEPTYGVYEVAARIHGAGIVRCQLHPEDFRLQPRDIERRVDQDPVKLVFICSPNNPTGNRMATEDIVSVAQAVREKAVVVVDEAYVEFSDQPSLARHIAAVPNLVVLRTLSKAWALAGARCGSVIAAPSVIALLHKVRAPYPLSTPAVDAVLYALRSGRAAGQPDAVQRLVRERQWLATQLQQRAYIRRVYPSDANFLLLEVNGSARSLYEHCLHHGIRVRDRSHLNGLGQCLRITVGARRHSEMLLHTMDSWPAAMPRGAHA